MWRWKTFGQNNYNIILIRGISFQLIHPFVIFERTKLVGSKRNNFMKLYSEAKLSRNFFLYLVHFQTWKQQKSTI